MLGEMDDEWVEIRRFVDATQAEMTRDFLRDHDIAARLRGNTAATSVLNRFDTVIDTRLDVRKEDLDAARDALIALEMGDAVVEEPFRGARPRDREEEGEYIAPKKTAAAMMLGFLVPIGAAHFYARHGAAGGILIAGIVGSFLGAFLGQRPELFLAWAVIVALDIALAPFAVRRYNAGRVPSEGRQRAGAALVVAAAFAVALLLGQRY